MWKGISKLLFLSLTVSRIRGHLAWSGSNQLHPVQGLYVKPSSDGTTGDLYVAATEEHGLDAHWLTDQPVNFLPSAAASATKPTAVPAFTSSFSKTSSPHEETVTTKKRAVITSPQIKYTYALPPTEAGSPYPTPYPYVAVPVASTPEGSALSCSPETTPAAPGYPQFSPFHYFYPQMMAAVSNAMTAINDANKESGSNSNTASQFWPHPFAYPYQYIMLDPASWIQGHGSTTSTATTATSEENV